MAKLSMVIPSRDEVFLIPTIHDAFRNACGEFEVVAVIDSDKWPDNWKSVTDQYPNLHTIFHGTPKGMRAAINSGVGSAISRGAKYIAKFDAHCSFSEGFDEVLKSECEPNWIVVPRRGRLDPENWCETELNKPPIDYHYLSFPDDPQDFGGPGLNGKPWLERAVARAQYDLDEEMSSQGSGWFMQAAYFTELELMDESSYGPFWNEFQEIGLKCWLGGGKVMVNKKAKYLHLHKGKKYGRGYHLPEKWLQQGRTHANLWAFNEAWPKQTLPFEWLIDHFWSVPSWPENWREVLYARRKPRLVPVGDLVGTVGSGDDNAQSSSSLKIHKAHYGIGSPEDIDVRERLQNLAFLNKDSLDIVVNNSTLTPGQNPFRGKKKQLNITYSIDGGDVVTRTVQEKDWLIIGPVRESNVKAAVESSSEAIRLTMSPDSKFCPYCVTLLQLENGRFPRHADSRERELREIKPIVCRGSGKEYIQNPAYTHIDVKSGAYIPAEARPISSPPRTPAALNDYLIRRFSISPQRLRGPMPIELRDFHRNDLAQLFAELGFKRGAEIGVAEGNYSEIILKANPEMEWLMVDPWGDYEENPQGKGSNRHKFAYEETKRKTEKYKNARMIQATSMEAVRDIEWNYLDAIYIDGNHLFDYCVQDLIEWSKRVRSGGIVSGDDYYALDQKRWIGGGVVEAVQAYVNAHRIPLWFLFSGHKSVDYFWVKP